jgi:hypothetical protein
MDEVVHLDAGKDLVCQAETEGTTWSDDLAAVTCPECRAIAAEADVPEDEDEDEDNDTTTV